MRIMITFRWTKRKAALLRLGGFAMVSSLVIAGVSARRARADVGEAALALGRDVAPLVERTAEGEGRPLVVNGQRLVVSSAAVDADASTVLDRYEAKCKAGSRALEGELDALPEKTRDDLKTGLGSAALGVLRHDDKREGVVACLAQSGEGGKKAMLARIDRFSQSHDLSELGALRYVHVRRTGQGTSRVLAVSATGALPLDAMFPREGDAAGSDHDVIPRPLRSRRILSAVLPDTTYGVWIYETSEDVRSAIAATEKTMRARGFDIAAPPGDENATGFSGHGRQIVFSAAEADGRTVVAIVELGTAKRSQ